MTVNSFSAVAFCPALIVGMWVGAGVEINFSIHSQAGNKKENFGCQIKRFGHQFQTSRQR